VSAAEALARAEAAGICLRLRPDGGVRMEAAEPPPADMLAALRRCREEVAGLLVARGKAAEFQARVAFYHRSSAEAFAALTAPDPELDAERAIMSLYYAGEGDA